MTNIMLDLETLGNGNNAVIIAIGAVKFDVHDGLGEEFYELINPQSCIDYGLKMDAATVMWWMKQSQEARNVFSDGNKTMHPLTDVLLDFKGWVGDPKGSLIWGNGANFDNVILSNAYKATHLEQPWPYWGDRCYRTVAALKKDIKRNRIGTHHNALDDAKTQAEHLSEILRSL